MMIYTKPDLYQVCGSMSLNQPNLCQWLKNLWLNIPKSMIWSICLNYRGITIKIQWSIVRDNCFLESHWSGIMTTAKCIISFKSILKFFCRSSKIPRNTDRSIIHMIMWCHSMLPIYSTKKTDYFSPLSKKEGITYLQQIVGVLLFYEIIINFNILKSPQWHGL